MDVDVDNLFLFDVTSFTETATGADVTLSVHLNEAPAGDVVLTLNDGNSAANGQRTFTSTGYGDTGIVVHYSVTGTDTQSDTALQGGSITVTLDVSPTGEYVVGATNSASLTILDDDKPGIRVAEIGTTTVIEGEANTEFFVSLLSQPSNDVTINLANVMTSRTLTLYSSYLSSDTVIGVKVNDTAVDSMLLPMGSYDFDGTMVTVSADTTISSDVFTDVGVSLDDALDMADTYDYQYSEVSFVDGSNMLTFTTDDWYRLQTVTIKGEDESVVEEGAFHTTDISFAGGLKNGNTSAKFTKFIDAVSTVIKLTESLSGLEASIAGGASLAIDFGSYELQGFKGASSSVDASTVNPGGVGALDTNAMSQAMTSGNNRVGNLFGKLGDLGISIDVIENPLNVIKLFLGQNIDLVTWDVPERQTFFHRPFEVWGRVRSSNTREIRSRWRPQVQKPK